MNPQFKLYKHDGDFIPYPVENSNKVEWIGTPEFYAYWRWWEDFANRRVEAKKNKKGSVSTVFLAIDHDFSFTGVPILFETMFFSRKKNDKSDTDCLRASTVEEARMNHAIMVKKYLEDKPKNKAKNKGV